MDVRKHVFVLYLVVLLLLAAINASNASALHLPLWFSAEQQTVDGALGVDEFDTVTEVLGTHEVPWIDLMRYYEDQRLLASDGASQDMFGKDVDVSGEVVVVGAHRNDDLGEDSGSAYIYCYDDTVWEEEVKLLPSDGAMFDYFGWAVSASDEIALISAWGDDDMGNLSGSAYIFRDNDTSWIEEAKLLASDGAADDYFGRSVSISGDVAVIGAYGDDDLGSRSGSVYIFRDNGTSWVEEVKLLASDGEPDDYFGRFVSISDDVAVIGAYGDDDLDSLAGSAYIFRDNGTSWVEEAKLLASDGEAKDLFGRYVSVSGDVVVVGAYGNDDNGSLSGSAYIYRYDGTSWVEEVKLLASDGDALDRFGHSVSVSGDVVVVGAYGDEESGHLSGSAYVYRYSDGVWVEEAKLLASDGAPEDCFGYYLDVSGGVAVMGAHQHDEFGNSSGSAYIFEIGSY
jgi:hypothetical protein